MFLANAIVIYPSYTILQNYNYEMGNCIIYRTAGSL